MLFKILTVLTLLTLKIEHFDANPDPDLERHQHGNSDPDRHQNDADPQH
jgi:hypothetical protein